ncbi:alpha-L-rhamnosidase [Arthrobacter sp. NicSoilC5]|uniref:alpha-L-rhamnosidase n=1 Tax=Arthrobacter sp. NicSoilC5 TaxID=2831000 RepID=UPI001CC63C02|nr:alpha-L-rhamnosidase [Arthrobacter sp. NicSoilC5]BCW78340.1 alpha-L-rhamnosidase [Arthrobacter sp. NicSoilC5]
MLETATMITADAGRTAAVVLTSTIKLDTRAGHLQKATLRATAHGVYEARIGGQPVSKALLTPGWTSYEWRLQVQEVDVIDLVQDGVDLEVLLGNGWYRGDLGFENANANYGEEIGFIGELELTYSDGSSQKIVTDDSWGAHASDTPENSLYNGQKIDARLRGAGAALEVRCLDFDRSTLISQVGPPVVRQESLRPQRIWTSPAGRVLVDFGQNLVGWLRFRVQGPAGSEITIRHAEVLEHEELGTRPLRGAKATDTFVLSGELDSFEPTLTFHGFRYAEITGWPGTPGIEDLEAVVVHSQMRRTGWFQCSNELVNKLVSNSIWSQKGNFLDVPTDCPQRDERLGWTGDLAAYASTATFQFETADFLHKWLLDLAEETRHGKYGVPHVVPDVLKYANFPDEHAEREELFAGPKTIWGDAAVWVPEALWNAYGDRQRLAEHYPGMVLHLESVLPRLSATGVWDQGFQFGDWLDPDAAPDEPWKAKADPGVVATSCLYRSARVAAETAELLGKTSDAERWHELAQRTRAAFNDAYVDGSGRIVSDCPTVYTLAICFALLPEDLLEPAGDRLAELVRNAGYRISTGFAGTPFINRALTETGHIEEAYRLLLETGNPSWLYPVSMGATTIWERWDSMLEDGTINPGEMTSFNHYALGAVVDWLYTYVAGLRPAEPGYSRLLLQPVPGPGLDYAKATLDTPHGTAECGWSRDGEHHVTVETLVPEGILADVILPDGTTHTIASGRHSFEVTMVPTA